MGAGLAFATKYIDEVINNEKSKKVTLCFLGDGALNQGAFHEAMNLARIWKLPVLFVCENNLYAMGTALGRHQAETDLALRASSYGMPAWPVARIWWWGTGISTLPMFRLP